MNNKFSIINRSRDGHFVNAAWPDAVGLKLSVCHSEKVQSREPVHPW